MYNVFMKERKKIGIDAGYYDNIMTVFSNVQFYDYTKIPRDNLPANYDLTFSYSGVATYQNAVKKALERNMRIAVVFRKKKNIPCNFMGMACVDGDKNDVRHRNPQGVVVALSAKGKAKKDTTGFVVD